MPAAYAFFPIAVLLLILLLVLGGFIANYTCEIRRHFDCAGGLGGFIAKHVRLAGILCWRSTTIFFVASAR